MPLAVAERSIPADYRLAGSRERLWHGEEALVWDAGRLAARRAGLTSRRSVA
jgi:hypothetical protein